MRRKGFTLVELLVVIGIIALLIAILMPALSRAKEQANWLKCLSNLRQVGQAFMMYCNNNKGRFPVAGANGDPNDWIFWEDMPVGTRPDRKLDYSMIAPYLGIPVNPEILRCPSDNVENRTSGNYRFSYSTNYLITRLPYMAAGYEDTNSFQPLRVTDIVNSSMKVLIIDESATTADDGCWAWMSTLGSGQNLISNRHMKRQELPQLRTDPNAGKGNACFADGHAEYIERKLSYDKRYYDPKYKS
jgi:prepilin-type N-terminal cleavage/methylation domain-containing protein/prepilin-type processing-associated H-X9-DG protein